MYTHSKVLLSLLVATTIVLWPARGGEEVISLDTPEVYTIEKLEMVKPPASPIEPVQQVDDVLKKIAWCESQNQQFNPDGSVHMGEINPQDTGKYQINEHYHLADSIKLGMDIYTLAGNTAYAKYLYSTQGTTPWNWSKHCWADPDRVWWEKDGEYWSE